MPTSHHSFDEPARLEADDPRIPEASEDVIDRVGIRLAMLVLCIAGFIAALWVLSTPSCEKYTVLTSASDAPNNGHVNEAAKPTLMTRLGGGNSADTHPFPRQLRIGPQFRSVFGE
jgi:hypothetical protein